MKQRFSGFSIAFFLFHLFLLCALIFSIALERVSISTDFVELMPSAGLSEGVAAAERKFTANQNGSVNLFFESSDFETARASALAFKERFDGSDVFVSLGSDLISFDIADLTELLHEHKYQLLSEEIIDEIMTDPEAFQGSSLARIFSPFTFSSLEGLESDPFLIEELIWRDYIAKASALSPFSPREGLLACEVEGRWYVLLQGTLSERALDISRTDGGIGEIYEEGDSLESLYDVQVYYSGLPFHSYESSSSAQKEIMLITSLSLLLLFVIFIVLLGNISVVLLFLISVAISIFSAAASLTLFFRDVHVFTLIFGTTLIGTSIDYAIHYYLSYAGRGDRDARAVARELCPNLSIGFGSTALCYLLLLFSPYGILKQVALFSAFGLASSYLTVMGLFPLIMRERMVSERALFCRLPEYGHHRSYLPLLLIISLLLFMTQLPSFSISNNISDLYEISDRLLESEMTAGKVMGYSSTSYCIVEGEDERDAVEKESAFASRLDALIEEGKLNRYLSPSLFIPSEGRQQQSLEAVRSLAPLLEEQCEVLSLDEERVREEFSRTPDTISLEEIPSSLSSSLSQLIPGEIDGKYYIVVMLLGSVDAEAVRSAASECEGVVFFQKSTDINRQLDLITAAIIRIFIIALLIILLFLVVRFRKKGLYMAMSPLITFFFTMGLAPLFGLSQDFFFAVGLLMVIGLGLDYMVFAGNSRKQPMLAITLSYLTTAISFGSLFLSSFRPVHIFGLTVLIGISAAYLTALLSGGGEKR